MTYLKLLGSLLLVSSMAIIGYADQPNVILIMSDDQGVGDYGFMGNPIIKTPALDRLRQNGTLLNNFYVSNVCAPTRASLMTGRYNYRTRCIDTYIGRAMMDSSEETAAEILRNAGYSTGIYGKWHLGDNYPLRPMDQGFQDCLVHRGGGIGQPSDPIGAEGKYTDPTLIQNGKPVSLRGYCTDLYFDAAMKFIEQNHAENRPFFTYIATNAPHGPFHDVPEQLYRQYLQTDFSQISINKPIAKDSAEHDRLARISAMITNIDENVDRLISKLRSLDALDNTIIFYLNDNGPNTMRYVGDMRGMKTHVDDGGIRSPLIVHWPSKIAAGKSFTGLCAHIDVLPTILDACDARNHASNPLDGKSFYRNLIGESNDWPQRTIILQSHRGNVPQRYHHFALHQGPWKLVNPSGFGRETIPGEPKFQLYNLAKDPKQRDDLSTTHIKKLAELKAAYDRWFDDVSNTRPDNYAPPRIIVGTKHEMETVLTRQDWRHTSGRPWAPNSQGKWLLKSEEKNASKPK